ncbi:MAG: BlaI/MecI/CopY family transcriptional regulator [Planctomycetota bacterium]|jgi:predicted transcriptional regulator
MAEPEGNLTSTQYEILETVWAHGGRGATVAEIWRAVSSRRSVGRTTILNLVDRLEKRRWLIRREKVKPSHYLAALDRDQTASLLAGGFVDSFFGGSAAELVMSLLGSKRLKPDDVDRLRRVLESADPKGSSIAGASRDDT